MPFRSVSRLLLLPLPLLPLRELEADVVTERLDGAEVELHGTEEEKGRQQGRQRGREGQETEDEQWTAEEPTGGQQVEEKQRDGRQERAQVHGEQLRRVFHESRRRAQPEEN